MTGWVQVTGTCVGCGALISFNPHRVPSVVVNGTREPICRCCVDRVNPQRIANGLPAIEVLAGAYDPIPESEL